MPDVGRSYSGTFTYFKCVATEGSKLVSKGTVTAVTSSSYLSNAKVNAHFIHFSTSTILYVLTLRHFRVRQGRHDFLILD